MEANLKLMSDLNSQLQSGEINLYECHLALEKSICEVIQLLVKAINAKI